MISFKQKIDNLLDVYSDKTRREIVESMLISAEKTFPYGHFIRLSSDELSCIPGWESVSKDKFIDHIKKFPYRVLPFLPDKIGNDAERDYREIVYIDKPGGFMENKTEIAIITEEKFWINTAA